MSRLPEIDALYAWTRTINPACHKPIVKIPGLLGSCPKAPDGRFPWGGPDRLPPDREDPATTPRLVLLIGDGAAPLASLRDGALHRQGGAARPGTAARRHRGGAGGLERARHRAQCRRIRL
jgi:hypothetical protein